MFSIKCTLRITRCTMSLLIETEQQETKPEGLIILSLITIKNFESNQTNKILTYEIHISF